MDSYTAAMNQRPQPQQSSPLRPQSPRGVTLEDAPQNAQRRNNSRFDSHDDFYEFLDNNRGPPATNPPPGSGTSEKTPPQAPALPPQPQRNQPSQSRPPLSSSNPDRVRPPSYTGTRSEELLLDKASGARVARQAVRRGVPPNKPSTGPRQRIGSPTPPVSGGSSPSHPQYATQSLSVTADDSAVAIIPRLKSPSVIDCVLQPLDQKVREYDQHMRREQDEIKRLDDELNALQARRAEAEARFNEVRAKHDEYRRQYNDVERAMTGELSMSPPQRPVTMHGAGPVVQQRGFADEYHEEFDDDEDFSAPPFGPGRRISSQQSFGRTSQKTAGKERFRFSNLFGANR